MADPKSVIGMDQFLQGVWDLLHQINRKLDILLDEDPPSAEVIQMMTQDSEYEDREEDRTPSEPRLRINAKDTRSGDDIEMTWDDLPDDVAKGVKMARSMREMYQVYIENDGSVRLVTTQEVVDALKAQQ